MALIYWISTCNFCLPRRSNFLKMPRCLILQCYFKNLVRESKERGAVTKRDGTHGWKQGLNVPICTTSYAIIIPNIIRDIAKDIADDVSEASPLIAGIGSYHIGHNHIGYRLEHMWISRVYLGVFRQKQYLRGSESRRYILY